MKNARWVRLADDLTRGITNGDYPLDSYLPTEMELCEKYNVSRYTVRLALADLTRMGLIKRWPRLGSKVVSVGFDETYAHTYTSFADIDGLSSTHKRVVQGTQECVVDHALAKKSVLKSSRRFPPFPFLQKPQCIWMLRSAHLASVFSATTWVLSGTSSKFQSLIIPATVTH